MFIQIVNFSLRNMSPAEYEAVCSQLVAQFVAMPGLISKVWLADPASNTFGGVYTWHDRTDCEAYKNSPLFKSVATHPNLTNVSSREFGVLEELTRITRGAAAHSTTA
jgi:quinol monooxygenase YgiN